MADEKFSDAGWVQASPPGGTDKVVGLVAAGPDNASWTWAQVLTYISASLVDSAPGTLDTLNELAAALGDDPNFAATMATALGLKAPLASPSLTGVPVAPTAAPGTNTTQLATTAFVDAARVILAAATALKANTASPTFTGVPAGPTAAPGTNTTQLATTAFVAAVKALLQPLDADLTAIAALTSAADKFAYATGAGTWALADLTAAGRALVDDADAAAQRTTLNVDASRLDLTLAPVFFDDFVTASTESGEIGELGWGFTNGSWGIINAVANHPGIAQRTSTAVNDVVASAFTAGGGTQAVILGSQLDELTFIVFLVTASTDAHYRFGLSSDLTANAATHGAYFEKLSTDTNWFAVNRLSAAETRSDMGVAAAAATWFKLKIRRVNSTTMAYSINGAAEIQIASNSPDAVSLAFGFHIIPKNSAARSVNVDAFAMRLQPNAR